ncbi:hypothetical protein DESPIG_02449 [Desulfovibrio piger ATCC 29098]|uniref:Uncharacterized protein n=1 Tax=Desulfovibrio piger ATCC 29098 TaxID=411464 RepID=B6WWI1_9BACT|nr:hypothetical protein DESPIG_02449 [Desulfovibrio piger ATCC 29098]
MLHADGAQRAGAIKKGPLPSGPFGILTTSCRHTTVILPLSTR